MGLTHLAKLVTPEASALLLQHGERLAQLHSAEGGAGFTICKLFATIGPGIPMLSAEGYLAGHHCRQLAVGFGRPPMSQLDWRKLMDLLPGFKTGSVGLGADTFAKASRLCEAVEWGLQRNHMEGAAGCPE